MLGQVPPRETSLPLLCACSMPSSCFLLRRSTCSFLPCAKAEHVGAKGGASVDLQRARKKRGDSGAGIGLMLLFLCNIEGIIHLWSLSAREGSRPSETTAHEAWKHRGRPQASCAIHALKNTLVQSPM